MSSGGVTTAPALNAATTTTTASATAVSTTTPNTSALQPTNLNVNTTPIMNSSSVTNHGAAPIAGAKRPLGVITESIALSGKNATNTPTSINSEITSNRKNDAVLDGPLVVNTIGATATHHSAISNSTAAAPTNTHHQTSGGGHYHHNNNTSNHHSNNHHTTSVSTTAATGKSSNNHTSGSSASSSKTTTNARTRNADDPHIGKYRLIKTIGKGNFAKVKLAKHELIGKEVAIKIIDKTQLNQGSLQKLFREVKIMKCLDHPNIGNLFVCSVF